MVGPAAKAPSGLLATRPALVISTAAALFGVPASDIVGPSRRADIFRARAAAMYALRATTHMSYPQISKSFGDRDHTSTMNAVRRASDLLGSDPEFQLRVVTLISALVEHQVALAENARGGVFRSRRPDMEKDRSIAAPTPA